MPLLSHAFGSIPGDSGLVKLANRLDFLERDGLSEQRAKAPRCTFRRQRFSTIPSFATICAHERQEPPRRRRLLPLPNGPGACWSLLSPLSTGTLAATTVSGACSTVTSLSGEGTEEDDDRCRAFENLSILGLKDAEPGSHCSDTRLATRRTPLSSLRSSRDHAPNQSNQQRRAFQMHCTSLR